MVVERGLASFEAGTQGALVVGGSVLLLKVPASRGVPAEDRSYHIGIWVRRTVVVCRLRQESKAVVRTVRSLHLHVGKLRLLE